MRDGCAFTAATSHSCRFRKISVGGRPTSDRSRPRSQFAGPSQHLRDGLALPEGRALQAAAEDERGGREGGGHPHRGAPPEANHAQCRRRGHAAQCDAWVGRLRAREGDRRSGKICSDQSRRSREIRKSHRSADRRLAAQPAVGRALGDRRGAGARDPEGARERVHHRAREGGGEPAGRLGRRAGGPRGVGDHRRHRRRRDGARRRDDAGGGGVAAVHRDRAEAAGDVRAQVHAAAPVAEEGDEEAPAAPRRRRVRLLPRRQVCRAQFCAIRRAIL